MMILILLSLISTTSIESQLSEVLIKKYESGEIIKIPLKDHMYFWEARIEIDEDDYELDLFSYSIKLKKIPLIKSKDFDNTSDLIKCILDSRLRYINQPQDLLLNIVVSSTDNLPENFINEVLKKGEELGMKIQIFQDFFDQIKSEDPTKINIYYRDTDYLYRATFSIEKLNINLYVENKLSLSECFLLEDPIIISRLFKQFNYIRWLNFNIEDSFNKFRKDNNKIQMRNGATRTEIINKFLVWSSKLTLAQHYSIHALFNSLSDDILDMVFKKIFMEYNQTYGKIVIEILRNSNYLNTEDLYLLQNYNMKTDTENILSIISHYKKIIFNKISENYSNKSSNTFLIFNICKALEDIYLSGDNCEWKDLYDEILLRRDIEKKTGCLINLFDNIFADMDMLHVFIKEGIKNAKNLIKNKFTAISTKMKKNEEKSE